MNNIISKRYYLELSVNDNKLFSDKELYCKANDSIQFHITVKEHDEIKDLTGCRVSIVSTRNDCTMIEQVIDDPTFEDGVLIIKPKKEFSSVVCTMTNEITIYDTDESITIQNFIFSVTKTLQGERIDEEAKDSIDSLIELNKIIASYKTEVEELKAQIESLRELADDKGHSHQNKEVLDLITEDTFNKWNDNSTIIGNALIENGLTITEAINDIYEKLSEEESIDLS